MPLRQLDREGFTLIELMLVTALVVIVGLAITATLSGGLKIFERMEHGPSAQADALLALERMESDVKNAVRVRGIDFKGEAKRVTIPSIIESVSGEEMLGSITYFLDDRDTGKMLSKEEKKYALAVSLEPVRGAITSFVECEDIHFQYLSYNAETQEYLWVDHWDPPEDEQPLGAKTPVKGFLEDAASKMPLGVRMKMSVNESGKIRRLDRTVFLPVAVSLHLALKKAAVEKERMVEVPVG